MARHPRKRHVQDSWVDHFRENMALQEYSLKGSIPTPLVRGLIRGLLLHFSKPARQRKSDEQGIDWQEYGLMELINLFAKETAGPKGTSYNDDEVNRYTSRIMKALDGLVDHPHPLALAIESDWLNGQLTPYGKLRFEQRITWFRTKLRGLLRELNQRSRCGRTTCPRNTTIPDNSELMKWAREYRTPVQIRHQILAHFHASTFNTVKRASSSSHF